MMKRPLALLVAASLLAGCTAPAPASKPSPTKNTEDQDSPLPVAAFIDSAALHQALLSAPLAPADFKLRTLFSVRYDSTGTLQTVVPVWSRAFPAEYGRTMSELLRAHVKPSIPTRRETWQRVWLQSGPTPKIAVLGGAVEARPTLNNRGVVGRELNAAVQRLLQIRPGLTGQQVTGEVTMRVTEDGRATDALLRRSTGDSEVDREILSVARFMRFSPARIDGYPVSSMIRVPISFVFTGPMDQPPAGVRP